MPKRVRVNVQTTVNASEIRREERNGRAVMIVPSVTMPDDIIMNGVKYPAPEIAKSFASLNRTPAPFGHPADASGAFLSARDPEAINVYHVGAWNENVRQIKDENTGRFRVHVDKYIDVAFAEKSENGKALLNAIEAGEPIHTSTGLWANIAESDAEDHHWVASDIEFDHDAILLNEKGAATPEQGVGMMVNKDGKKVEVEVINSMLDRAEEQLDWAALEAIRALKFKEDASLVERLKSAFKEAFASLREPTATNNKEFEMDKEQFEALSAKVDTLAASVEALTNAALTTESVADAIASAIEPVQEDIEAIKNSGKEAEEAELAGYVEKIVAGNMMDEEEAKELPLKAAKALANKCKPKSAAGISPAFQINGNGDDEFKDYDPNAHLEEAN